MIDTQTFAAYAAECTYRDEMSCTRRRESMRYAPSILAQRCEYDVCPLLQPCVRPQVAGGFVVSVVEEFGRTAVVEGPFSLQHRAQEALKKYPTRAAAVAAVMARRS